MSGDGVLKVLSTDGVVELRLNRPEKLNALDDALFDALVEATAALRHDRSLRAVVVTGEGRAFCAGLDFERVRAFADEAEAGAKPFGRPGEPSDGKRQPGRGQEIVQNLRLMPVPVIAAINGPAIGGGLQIALGADIWIVSETSVLAVRELDFGITQDMGGTQLLPRLVGFDRAMELCLTGRAVEGSEAVDIGLATSVSDDPLDAAWSLARQIVNRNPEAVEAMKALMRYSERSTVDQGFAVELGLMASNIGRPNQVEASAAYFEKRPPTFEDRSLELPAELARPEKS